MGRAQLESALRRQWAECHQLHRRLAGRNFGGPDKEPPTAPPLPLALLAWPVWLRVESLNFPLALSSPLLARPPQNFREIPTMSQRYYCSEPITGPQVLLAGSEAHHLLHVMRAQPGTQVVLLDGHGSEFDAEVTACGRSTVELAVGAQRSNDRELPMELVLGIPLPKGDRQRWLVEKAVELGVCRLVPLRTERSASSSDGSPGAKLARYVIEATKQCGRNRLMEIAPPCAWDEWLRQSASRRLVAHFGGQPIGEVDLQSSQPTLLAIGPEGGFTDEEAAQALADGWQLVDLGRRVLRMETAAVALAAAVALGK